MLPRASTRFTSFSCEPIAQDTGTVEFEIVELTSDRLVLAPVGSTDPAHRFECRRVH
jgi:hypothetical protein